MGSAQPSSPSQAKRTLFFCPPDANRPATAAAGLAEGMPVPYPF